ncbi:MAG: glucose 1-dehydrogenase [Gammaproteobacteria bacterium]|nr:glucose 1-dehydrogenase [Gammaproteobacteria bacterium]
MLDLKLKDKVAIVTGASRGLGEASAIALAEQGAKVLAVARSEDALNKLKQCFPEQIEVSQCDMLDADSVAALPQLAFDHFNQIDIIVNNAGIAPAGKFSEQSQQIWDEVFAVNVKAPAVLARAAGQFFIQQKSGKIINIASTSGILGKPILVAYSSSKGAVLQFTKALAAEWAALGIQVNAIAPGAFETDAQSAVLESAEILERRLRKIPSKRMGNSEEIGPMVCYLASSFSDFVTGSVIVMDGGESSKL